MVATTPRRLVTPDDAHTFVDLRESGHTLCQIARMTGFSPASIHKHMGNTERSIPDCHLDPANHPDYGTINRILMTTFTQWREATHGKTR